MTPFVTYRDILFPVPPVPLKTYTYIIHRVASHRRKRSQSCRDTMDFRFIIFPISVPDSFPKGGGKTHPLLQPKKSEQNLGLRYSDGKLCEPYRNANNSYLNLGITTRFVSSSLKSFALTVSIL